MTRRPLARILGSSLIVTTSVVGCSGASLQQRPALVATEGSVIATGIEHALNAKDFARALLDAERLVEAKPREAGYRVLLGRAYLANGRYQSARTAFEDAMTLGANDPRTLVSLALIRTALGDAVGARDFLSSHISDLPAADYGLAMAMAGDPAEGVRALLEATRGPDADARTRQNLAYALALGGEWGQARLVAGQDLNGSALQQRLQMWAATAAEGAAPQRIAAFMGVAPRGDDAGQPERLALAHSAPAALASAAPQAPAALAETASAELPASQPEPQPLPLPEQAAPAPLAEATIPLIKAPEAPMREAASTRESTSAAAAFAMATQGAATGWSAEDRSDAAVPSRAQSDWVVQIGAFSDSRAAKAGWTRAKGRALEQKGYRRVTATITLGGRTWHRLALGGFGDRLAALNLCATLKADGQSCFVRRDAGLATEMRMAQKPAQKVSGPKIASR